MRVCVVGVLRVSWVGLFNGSVGPLRKSVQGRGCVGVWWVLL